MNRAELFASVLAIVEHQGQKTTDFLPVALAMTEAEFNRELSHPRMEVYAAIDVQGGQFRLPENLIEVQNIEHGDGSGGPFTYVHAQAFDGLPDTSSATEFDRRYTIQGRTILVYPAFLEQTEVRLRGRAVIPPLVSDIDKNWLSEGFPDAYIYKMVAHVAGFLFEDKLEVKAMQRGNSIVASINDDGRRSLTPEILNLEIKTGVC